MSYVTHTETTAIIYATTDDGVRIALNGSISQNKIFYPVREITEGINVRNLFRALAGTTKSSQDLLIFGELLHDLNVLNELTILNITKLAEYLTVSRSMLNALLERAVNTDLMHKLDTGRYLVNPYRFMGAGATRAGYAQMELVQARWKELTGLLTELEIEQLLALSKYLNLPNGLPGTEFNLSVARYYATNNTITAKQKSALKQRGVTVPDQLQM